jgi:hypothetical protein
MADTRIELPTLDQALALIKRDRDRNIVHREAAPYLDAAVVLADEVARLRLEADGNFARTQ